MKVGLVVPQFGTNATKENLITFMQLAEREGFESLWVMIGCYILSIPNSHILGLQIKENGLNFLRTI